VKETEHHARQKWHLGGAYRSSSRVRKNGAKEAKKFSRHTDQSSYLDLDNAGREPEEWKNRGGSYGRNARTCDLRTGQVSDNNPENKKKNNTRGEKREMGEIIRDF